MGKYVKNKPVALFVLPAYDTKRVSEPFSLSANSFVVSRALAAYNYSHHVILLRVKGPSDAFKLISANVPKESVRSLSLSAHGRIGSMNFGDYGGHDPSGRFYAEKTADLRMLDLLRSRMSKQTDLNSILVDSCYGGDFPNKE